MVVAGEDRQSVWNQFENKKTRRAGGGKLKFPDKKRLIAALAPLGAGPIDADSNADGMIKSRLSLTPADSDATGSKRAEWMCGKGSWEIGEPGDVMVKDELCNLERVSHDHKYTAAEGTKVAQTVLNGDDVTFMAGISTAAKRELVRRAASRSTATDGLASRASRVGG